MTEAALSVWTQIVEAFPPAFLFHALGDLSKGTEMLEFTLYALCGAHEADEATTKVADTQRRERIADFTLQQRAALRAFLSLTYTELGLNFHHDATQCKSFSYF